MSKSAASAAAAANPKVAIATGGGQSSFKESKLRSLFQQDFRINVSTNNDRSPERVLREEIRFVYTKSTVSSHGFNVKCLQKLFNVVGDKVVQGISLFSVAVVIFRKGLLRYDDIVAGSQDTQLVSSGQPMTAERIAEINHLGHVIKMLVGSIPTDLSTFKPNLINSVDLFYDKGNEDNRLGSPGNFGEAWKAALHSTTYNVAFKRLLSQDDRSVTKLMKEVTLMRKLQHPNIVRVYGVCLEA